MEEKTQQSEVIVKSLRQGVNDLLNGLRGKLPPESIETKKAWREDSKYLSDACKQALSKLLKYAQVNIITPRVLSLMGGQFSYDDCDEVNQLSFIRLNCEIPMLFKLPDPVGWINRIVYYVFIDFLRKRKNTVSIEELINIAVNAPQWRTDFLQALQHECERWANEKYPKDKNMREREAKYFKIIVQLLYKGYNYEKITKALRRLHLVKKGCRGAGIVKKYVRQLKKDSVLKNIIQFFVSFLSKPSIKSSDLAGTESS